jgi:hypothetical protein
LEPGFYKKNAQMLAQTYARLGNRDEARKWRETTLQMPTITLDDREAHQAAEALKL